MKGDGDDDDDDGDGVGDDELRKFGNILTARLQEGPYILGKESHILFMGELKVVAPGTKRNMPGVPAHHLNVSGV